MSEQVHGPGKAALALVTAWLVPGAGHVVLGRVRRGVLFSVLVFGSFALGLAHDGRLALRDDRQPFLSVLQVVANAGVGPCDLAARWAVYGEQTMLDQGYGDSDLRLRLMQLKFYLRAVGNAILDHKMHCTKMTDAEAMKFLVEDAFQSEGEARLKIIRAKQSSVQLSTYFVGRMAHYRLHQQMQRELGDKFELGRYHEAVVGCGSVPVKYLPELVRARLNRPR